MSELHLRPGIRLGRYPQQHETWPSALESHAKQHVDALLFMLQRRKYCLTYISHQVKQYETALRKLSDNTFQAHIHQLKLKLQQQGLQEHLIHLSFATIREAAHRVLGKRHYDEQLLGGWVIINGMIAEMETGQGKTLTATLASCTAAMAGIPVHVMTSNDYLAARDEELLNPLYQWLGISSASIIDGMETEQRNQAYQSQIVHATSQQIAFDYLRDRMSMGDDIGKMQIQFKQIQSQQQHQPSPFLLRGLCFGILDEADSLLIDEAKTPLIISQTRGSENDHQIYYDALFLATSLDKSIDYNLIEQQGQAALTSSGKHKLTQLTESLDDYWQRRRQREFMVTLALKATHLFHRGEHYLVRNDKVEIIDPMTGRSMPDRSWEQGLHQIIEAKEGCEITGEKDPLARISYQKFFKRYLRLSGMSGTVSEVAKELSQTYGLRVIKIPTHQPSRRIRHPDQVFKNHEQKHQAFITKIKNLHQQGRPVLIGTRTVAESEKLSVLLTEHALPHQVLNARQDQQEAQLVANAGLLNNITVATNMAGRGTDIELGQGVTELGGLYVINTERNDSPRVDRQLYGRCARQGDPGTAEGFMSLEDSNIIDFYPDNLLKILALFCLKDHPMPTWLGHLVLSAPQFWTEYRHYRQRKLLIEQEKRQTKTLAFTGRME